MQLNHTHAFYGLELERMKEKGIIWMGITHIILYITWNHRSLSKIWLINCDKQWLKAIEEYIMQIIIGKNTRVWFVKRILWTLPWPLCLKFVNVSLECEIKIWLESMDNQSFETKQMIIVEDNISTHFSCEPLWYIRFVE